MSVQAVGAIVIKLLVGAVTGRGSEYILLSYAFWGMRSADCKASGTMSRLASRLLFLPVSTMSGSARSNQSSCSACSRRPSADGRTCCRGTCIDHGGVQRQAVGADAPQPDVQDCRRGQAQG